MRVAGKKAKTKKKTRRSQAKTASTRLSGWVEWLTPRLARNLVMMGIVVFLVCGVSLGMAHLEDRVHDLPRYDHHLLIEWADLPDWLKLTENRHILASLTQSIGLKNSDRQLDRQLASRLCTSLKNAGKGWIQSVDRVTLRPDGRVTLHCRFRRPTAWVRYHDFCYLVDDLGIRLPGRYDPEDCDSRSLLMITGVKATPPKVDHLWTGSDLSAGLKLATLIGHRAFRQQVVRIIVANYNGRIDRHRPYLELATDRPGSRIWWGRPPNEEDGTEIKATQKIRLLETLYRQWGRIDLNRTYVDVRTHPDSVVMPVAFDSHGRRPAENNPRSAFRNHLAYGR